MTTKRDVDRTVCLAMVRVQGTVEREVWFTKYGVVHVLERGSKVFILERRVFAATKGADNIGRIICLTTLKLEQKVYSGNMSMMSMMEMKKESFLK